MQDVIIDSRNPVSVRQAILPRPIGSALGVNQPCRLNDEFIRDRGDNFFIGVLLRLQSGTPDER